MRIELELSESETKVVRQLKKKLSSKGELKKESHIIEAIYLALFLYSIGELDQADNIVSIAIETYGSNEDFWEIVIGAYYLKWSLLLHNGDELAADRLQKYAYSIEYDTDFKNLKNADLYERYRYHQDLLPDALESIDHEKDPWFHCSMLGQEVMESHRYLFFYRFFQDCMPSNSDQEVASNSSEMYGRLAIAVRSFV